MLLRERRRRAHACSRRSRSTLPSYCFLAFLADATTPALLLGVAAGGGVAAGDGAALFSRPSSATRPARRRSAARPWPAPASSTRSSASRGSSSRCTPRPGSASPSCAYVFAGLYLSVFYLYQRYRVTSSRVEKTRLLYLVVGGFGDRDLGAARALPHGPRFGNIFIIVYLYFLSQNLFRYRLLDLNELLGPHGRAGDPRLDPHGDLRRPRALGRARGARPFFFNTLLASTAIAHLLEPLRGRVEGSINRWMFQEKYELNAPHREPARRAGQRHRHARAGAARTGSARGFAPHHPLVDLPGRSRRRGLRAGRPRGPASRGALRRHHSPRVLRAPAARGRRSRSRGSNARTPRGARSRPRSARACISCARSSR